MCVSACMRDFELKKADMYSINGIALNETY